jgi:hypothetical protein
MKKRVEKPKAKSAKSESAKSVPVAPKALAKGAVSSPQDPLHDLLRGTYAHRACR